ncbi:WhiB family transcriptional regulator [Streptomyces sp. MI02-7b]|uniref:WhiB family transcriptional regulator n=1 Tax=Streptomyces sp. MI02-7b TaxID=462941 RepID=UPI0029A8CB60|nr:WhiB family transcriptional regulator [Streptomyces sp. MI02-7b]MDX3074596.1 WhiB family transcriptional regulator [Streptomyces sp. MI02-7b]
MNLTPDFLDQATGPVPCSQEPDLFFSLDDADRIRAVKICRGCPLLVACHAHATDADELGVWGGQTRAERRGLRRRGGVLQVPAEPVEELELDDEDRLRRECGSVKAYRAHRKFGETPCRRCQAAWDANVETERRAALEREHALPAGGSVTGYHTHRRLNEPTCDPCRAALRVQAAERRAADKRKQSGLTVVPPADDPAPPPASAAAPSGRAA